MCRNSRLIKHPHCDYNLRHCSSVFINGKQVYLSDVTSIFSNLDSFIAANFSYCNLSPDEIYLVLCNNSYIVRKGRRFPVFLRLCCGTCSECRFLYKKEIENRALIEASESSHVFFYTLTYDDEHLPYDGLHKSDVSSSFKRLRQHIERYLGFPVHFTQLYVGEYGTDTRHSLRPHYHGLIFIEEKLTPQQILEFFDLFSIYESYYDFHERKVTYKLGSFYSNHKRLTPWWSKGLRIDIQGARNVSALVRYVCKYITKGFSTDFNELLIHRERFEQHSNPLFVQLPKKRGLGCGNVEKYYDDILRSTNGCISINVHGTIERIKIPRIFISKLFPSLSSLCPNANYHYKCLEAVLSILNNRSSYLSHYSLKPILDFIRLRIDSLDYLKYITLRKSQQTHLDISVAFYNEMSDYELIETSQLLFDYLTVAFDIDSFDNRSFMLSDFQSHSHSSCPIFNAFNISKKISIDTVSDLSYIEKNMKFSFFDSFV